MNLTKAIACLSLVLFILLVYGIACDNVILSKIQPPIEQSSISVKEICTSPPSSPDIPMKILFLLDMSGSNCTQAGTTCDASGTDPDKSFRFGLVSDFISRHRTEANLSYGAIGFQGTQALPLIGDGTSTYFRKAEEILGADLNQLKNLKDQGATPYRAALALAKTIIQSDAALPAAKPPKYYIVLLSDGMPTDYGDPPDRAQIEADVTALMKVAQISTFSTIYYNQRNILEDADLLKRIATIGHGGFANMNTDQKYIPLEDLMAFSNSVPWWITRFVVTNLSSAPCEDGSIDVDSDSDGICDRDERDFNATFAQDPAAAARMNGKRFDPQNRNSFHSSYGDLFYFRKIRFNEALDLGCPLIGNPVYDDQDHDLVNTCEERFLSSVTPLGITPDWTSAMQQTADANNFDSDGDGFTDWLEFDFGRSQSAAMNSDSVDATVRDYKMSDILLKHLHPVHPEKSTPYDGSLKFSRTNESGQNCYSYNQKILPLYDTLPVRVDQVSNIPELVHKKGENVVLIYFIERPEFAMNGPGRLRYYYQKIDKAAEGLDFLLELDSSKYKVYDPVNSRVSLKLNLAK